MPKRMNESTKTTWFAFVGAAMLGLAILTYAMNQPAKRTDFERVGQAFFENFESSRQASSLDVVAIDPDSARTKEFRVEEKDGVWSIPSHFGYPAEASDRLAKTSSSLLGLSRESLVGRLAADHERFGVVDPLNEESVDPEAAGKRITIKDENDDVLVDLIIGKEAGEEALDNSEIGFEQRVRRKNFYVRHPDEVQTYKVALNLDLSTRFSDWIRPDLLDLEGAEVTRMDIDNYELVEQAAPIGNVSRILKKQGDQMNLYRETGFGPWTLKGLDEETSTLDSAKINAAVSTLDSLKIVGVRKKPSFNGQQILNPDFTVNQIPPEEVQQNPQQYIAARDQFLNDLSENGYNLRQAEQGSQQLEILPNSGQMTAGRSDGVVYTLLFGNPISGDENEIEIGVTNSQPTESESQTTEAEENEDVTAEPGEASDDSAGETEPEVKNRFLMIRVDFDESLLGEKPVAPVEPQEPTKPDGYIRAEEKTDPAGNDNNLDEGPSQDQETNATDATETESETNTEQPAEEEGDPSGSGGEQTDDRSAAFLEYDLAMTEYENQKTQYEIDKTKFETETKQHAEKVEQGKKLVDDLNERFGTWFYVISADNLNSLQLKRDELVTAKNPPANEPSGLPARPNIQLEEGSPPDSTEPPVTSTDSSG